jgi:membrane-bound metal-dependent hydrolase YbcI (DUF457 family)
LDNLTHSLFGLTLARTPLRRVGPGTTAALLLASNAPDVDIIGTLGGAANYLEFHRGPTHGPLGAIVLGLAVALLVWLGHKRWGRASPDPHATFPMLWFVSVLGIVCHVLMDLPTSYGTRALSPFTWTWFAVDWMPIVDVYLLAILGGGLWFARGSHSHAGVAARRGRIAAVALLLMSLNYGVRAVSHHIAVNRASEVFGGRLPEWCAVSVRPGWGMDRWPRSGDAPRRDVAATHCLVEVAAIPDFLSPFRWKMIAQLSNGYEMRDIDLLSARGTSNSEPLARRTLSVRVPNQWTPAVVKAATAPTARVFLAFSRFPAARSFVADDGTATVRWSDMRFVQGAVDNPRQFRRGLFGTTVVLRPDGSIQSDRLGP